MTTSYVECLQALQNQTYTTPEQKVACVSQSHRGEPPWWYHHTTIHPTQSANVHISRCPFFHHRQLKVLKVFTKNLLDPVKAKDEKYRQVRLDNCKIQQTLVPCNPAAVEYLHSLGFTPAASSDDQVLRMETMIDAEVMAAALTAVQQALETLGVVKANNPPTTLQHQPSSSSTLSSSSSATTNSTERLTEKQKARRLLEAQRQAELAQAKQSRKKTAALIQQDKYVRAKDENWTSGPSAAVHKAGNAIPTFRDRHGE